MTPLISIIMPAYNAGVFIQEAIQCILDQSFTDWELIIINDGSTDNTQEVIEKFTDPRIRAYHFTENRGHGWASNQAMRLVSSPMVARMDADDLCDHLRLEKQYNFLQNNPDVTVVRTYVSVFTNDPEVEKSEFYAVKKNISEPRGNQNLSREEIADKLYWHLCLISATTLIRMDAIRQIDYSDDFRTGEDYHLLYKLNKNGFIIDTIPEVLYYYRIVQGSSTDTNAHLNAEIIYQIKREEIAALFQNAKVLIWGTGGLAKQLSKLLQQDNLKISGYIDFDINKKSDLESIYAPEILNPEQHRILIAATPVREKIVSYLQSKGFQHIKDFIVFL